jgi:hypothetical protein
MPRSPARVAFAIGTAILLAACRSAGVPRPAADAIVEGRADSTFVVDTIDDGTAVGLRKARWALRPREAGARDFWTDISALDVPSAEQDARTMDQRAFVVALRELMASEPKKAAVAFVASLSSATDALARAQARIGLTVALSWTSDWPALARLAAAPDSADVADSLTTQASVERWARALAAAPVPVIDVPDSAVTLPLRRSAFGTPVVTVRINGQPHELWLDTGASLTVLSRDVAREAGVRVASADPLALGVVSGHIPARAVLIDSLGLGPVVARGISAALVDPAELRLDRRVVNGAAESVKIDGVLGTDILRHLDLVLDAEAGTITVRRPRATAGVARNLFWIGYPIVRLVTAEGRPVLLGLDTGAEGSFVTTGLLRRLPRTPVAMRRRTLRGLGSEALTTEWVARELALGDGDYALTLQNVPVTPERRYTFVTLDGVMGSDVALSSRLHLDFVNGIFDVRPGATLPPGMVKLKIGH